MTLRLGDILRAIILLTVAIAFFGFSISSEPHPYIDWRSHVLFFALASVIFLACGRVSEIAPVALVLLTTLYAFVISRIAFLYLYPDGFLGQDRLSPDMFAGALLYILLGTVVAIIACVVVESIGKLGHGVAEREIQAVTNRGAIFFLAIISALKLLTFFFDDSFGFSGATGSGEHLGFFERYFAFLINPQAACFVALIVTAHGARSSKQRLRFAASCIGIYAAYLFLSGSRGSMFEALLTGLAFAVVFLGNRRFWFRKDYLIGGALLFIFSILAWPLVTSYREIVWLQNKNVFAAVPLALEDAFSTHNETWLEKLAPISQRVSLLEPTVYPLYADELGFGAISDLVNVESATLGTLSRVLPGNPFGEYLFGEYAFGFFLGRAGVKYDSSKLSNFVGYEWGMFGISYQVFGYIGGLVCIFFITSTIAFFVRVCRARPEAWAHLTSFFFAYTMNSWVHNLGIDNLVDRTVRIGIVIIVYAVLLGMLRLRRSSTAKRTTSHSLASPSLI